MSEFVLSNELVSMALAMVAENPEVNDILSELFTPDGNELYVHPASRSLRCASAALCASLRRERPGFDLGCSLLRGYRLSITGIEMLLLESFQRIHRQSEG